MTERLYYTDAYLAAFDATVLAASTREDGRHVVTLDRTAFYPTSGGQPNDRGRLGGFAVVDVDEDEQGTIRHVLEGGEPGIGVTVRAEIDWARRFDHMQQHTGQHVLSAAFDRLFRVRTVGFHLGAATSTIDLSREVSTGEIASAEDEANRIVWEDRGVGVRFASPEEAAVLPLRKEPKREGPLRLIDIEGFDLSACGGTHVARAGGVGMIAVASSERFKGGQRVEFVCGGRALARLRALRDTAAAATRLLSLGVDELPAAVQRLLDEQKEQRRALVAANTELARYRAEALAASAEPLAAGRAVLQALDADAVTLKAMATTIVSKPGYVVVLVSSATPVLIVIARSSDVSVAANEMLAALTTEFGGRGGGKPDLAQGGNLNAAPAAVLTAARGLLVR